VTYDEWEATVSARYKVDRLWRMRVYRLACYLSDLSWPDSQRLAAEPITREIATQLYTAVGSIASNLSEGYSRSGGRDRARAFEFALGSTRESREWYRHSTPVLGLACVDARTDTLEEIIRLLLAIIPRERVRKITRDTASGRRRPPDGDPASRSSAQRAVPSALQVLTAHCALQVGTQCAMQVRMRSPPIAQSSSQCCVLLRTTV